MTFSPGRWEVFSGFFGWSLRCAPVTVVVSAKYNFVFMERHWQAVTRRLSEATARDIAESVDFAFGYVQARHVMAARRWGGKKRKA